MTLVVHSSPTCKPVVVFSDPFFSQILPFSPDRQSSCFGSSVWWGLSRDSVLETDPGQCHLLAPGHLHPPTVQYSGSSSLQGFCAIWRKAPQISGADHDIASNCICYITCPGGAGVALGLVPLFKDRLCFTDFGLWAEPSLMAGRVAEFCLSFYRRR